MAMCDFLTLKVLSVSFGFQRYYDDDFGGNLFTLFLIGLTLYYVLDIGQTPTKYLSFLHLGPFCLEHFKLVNHISKTLRLIKGNHMSQAKI